MRSAVKCSSCKFFKTTQMDEDVGQGWCKRYAPQGTWPMIDKKDEVGDWRVALNYSQGARYWWPLAGVDDWCGDYAAKETFEGYRSGAQE